MAYDILTYSLIGGIILILIREGLLLIHLTPREYLPPTDWWDTHPLISRKRK